MNLPRFVVPLSVIGTGIGAYVLFQDAPRFTNDVRIPGRTVIVTGANTGIGKVVAEDMATRGARVIMGCRDLSKCEKAREEIMEASYNRNVVCKKLDLSSLKSVREFAKDINENEKRLDILINNAGVMGCPREITEEGFEMHLVVNFLGPFLLNKLLTDKLTECAPSRIINTATVALSRARINFRDLNSVEKYDYKTAYMQSKLAVMLSSITLAEKLKGTGVNVYTVNPGLTKSELGRHLDMNKSRISGTIVAPLVNSSFKPTILGAQTTLYCALEPSLGTDTGRFYREVEESEHPVHNYKDKDLQRLWLIAEKWTEARGNES